jgi:hypothetical protein
VRAWLRDPRNRRRFIIGAAAAAVVVLLFLRRSGAAAPAAAAATTDTGTVGPLFDPSTLTDGTPGGLGVGGVSDPGAVGGVTPATADDIGNLTDEIGNLQDQLNNLGDTSTAADGTPLTPSPTDTGTAPSAPAAGGAASAPGFWWNVGGKQTFVTRKNVSAFLAELKKHGVSVSAWAAAHAQAARDVGIPVPATAPPRQPGQSSPARETGGAARAQPTSQVATATPVPAAARLLPSTPPPAAPAPSFQWGGRTWHRGERSAFTSYLSAHGTSYATWARQHPAAAAIL